MSEEVKEKVPVCKECLETFKPPIAEKLIWFSLMLMLCVLALALTAPSSIGGVGSFIIFLTLLSSFGYFFVRRNIIGYQYYAFNDKQGKLHFHAKEPMFSEEKQSYFSPSLIQDNKSSFDDMAITGPILRLCSGGWFRKNKILGVRSGNQNFYHSSYAIKQINFNFSEFNVVRKLCIIVEFNSNGLLVRTPWLDLNNALRIISITDNHELYEFVIKPDQYFVHMDSYKLMQWQAKKNKEDSVRYEKERQTLLSVIRDAIALIASWRGAEQSKVGMGARLFLEAAEKAYSERPSVLKDPNDTLTKYVRRSIIEESDKNAILKRFIQNDDDYKAADPPAQKNADWLTRQSLQLHGIL